MSPARLLLLSSALISSCSLRAVTKSERSMNETEARHRLAQARALQWSFPTSSGRPVSRPAAAVEQLAAERGDFAQASQTLLASGDTMAALELAANAWRLFVLARDEAGGRAFLGSVLDRTPSTPTRARALASYGDGLLAFRRGDLVASRARSTAALEAARAVGDAEAELLARLGLSRVELSEHHADRAAEHARASYALAGNLGPAFGQAPLHMLAQSTRLLGLDDEAAKHFRESLELNRRIGDAGMVLVELHNLGHVELRLGHVDSAEQAFVECAALSGDDDPYDVAMASFNRAAIAFARRDWQGAASLLKQARETLSNAKLELAVDDAEEFDRLSRQLESQRDSAR